MKTATQGHKRRDIEFKKLSKRKTWTEAEQAKLPTWPVPPAAWEGGERGVPSLHRLPSHPQQPEGLEQGLLTTACLADHSAQQSPRSTHGINGREAASECDDLGGHMQRYPEHGNRPPRHSLGSGGSAGAAMLAIPLA